MLVFVSIPRQEAVVYRNCIRIGCAACSNGKPGHGTPTGVFQILQKDIDHHPTSVVVSTCERRAVINRNGKKVGAYSVKISGSLSRFKCEEVLLFSGDNRWHPLEGNDSFQSLSRDLRAPEAMRAKMHAMVLTSEPISVRGGRSRDVMGSE